MQPQTDQPTDAAPAEPKEVSTSEMLRAMVWLARAEVDQEALDAGDDEEFAGQALADIFEVVADHVDVGKVGRLEDLLIKFVRHISPDEVIAETVAEWRAHLAAAEEPAPAAPRWPSREEIEANYKALNTVDSPTAATAV